MADEVHPIYVPRGLSTCFHLLTWLKFCVIQVQFMWAYVVYQNFAACFANEQPPLLSPPWNWTKLLYFILRYYTPICVGSVRYYLYFYN